MRLHKNWLHQVPSSAYNQTVQWAIKEDEDKVEDLWRGLYYLDQKRQEINQSLAVSELPVGGKKPPSLFSGYWQRRFRLDLYLETSGYSGVVRTHCLNGKTQKLKLSFQCLKKIDNILIKEKQTHYFDEKQLVCCQLGAEFTLLVKCAAGSDVFFFSFFCMSSERKLALDREASLSALYHRKILLWQKFGIAKQHICRKNKSSWQINMADGVKNMRCDCALQRLRSAFYPVF